MSWDFIFPTRNGDAAGSSIENRMLGKVGGAGSIRTEVQTLPDGSTVMLRTRNGFPEFTRTAPKAIEAALTWAWPWHGLSRNNGTADVVETEFSGDIPLRGMAPATAQPRGFNCAVFAVEDTEFQSIPAPTESPLGAEWVNYATCSNGVLFGENVGMGVWLYTAGAKAWVVASTVTGLASITLDFYGIDNWVAGMDVEAAADFVKYDKTPTPYMTKKLPSGATRVAVKTIELPLPPYYRATTGTVIVKKGATSFDGSRAVFAYEVQIPNYPATEDLGALLQSVASINKFAEDQWIELVISGASDEALDAELVTLRNGASLGSFEGRDNPERIGDELAHPYTYSGSNFYLIPWDAHWGWRTVSRYEGILSYQYSPSGEALPVTLKSEPYQSELLDWTGGGSSGGYVLPTTLVRTWKYGVSMEVSFNGWKTTFEKREGSVHTVSGFLISSPGGDTFSGTVTTSSDILVDGVSILGDGGNAETTAGSLPNCGVHIAYIDGVKYWQLQLGNTDLATAPAATSLTPSANQVATPSLAMRTPILADFTADSGTSIPSEVGDKRWYPLAYAATAVPYRAAEDAPWLKRRLVLTRDAYDLYTLGYVDQDDDSVTLSSNPLRHLTQYGFLEVQPETVLPDEFAASTSCTAVVASKAAVGPDGHSSTQGVVKYGKLDGGVYRPRRYL